MWDILKYRLYDNLVEILEETESGWELQLMDFEIHFLFILNTLNDSDKANILHEDDHRELINLNVYSILCSKRYRDCI